MFEELETLEAEDEKSQMNVETYLDEVDLSWTLNPNLCGSHYILTLLNWTLIISSFFLSFIESNGDFPLIDKIAPIKHMTNPKLSLGH